MLNFILCKLRNSISGCSAAGSAGGLGPSGRRFEPCHSDHKSTVILIELRWRFSMSENRLIQGFSGISTHKAKIPLRRNSAAGFSLYWGFFTVGAMVIVKLMGIRWLYHIIGIQRLCLIASYAKSFPNSLADKPFFFEVLSKRLPCLTFLVYKLFQKARGFLISTFGHCIPLSE